MRLKATALTTLLIFFVVKTAWYFHEKQSVADASANSPVESASNPEPQSQSQRPPVNEKDATDPSKVTLFIIESKACDKGSAIACFDVGLDYDRGLGVARNSVKAVGFWQNACAAGDGQGCFNVGVLYDHGDGVARNDAIAAQFYDRACVIGALEGCLNLAADYDKGDGVPRDEEKAIELLTKACKGGLDQACHWK